MKIHSRHSYLCIKSQSVHEAGLEARKMMYYSLCPELSLWTKILRSPVWGTFRLSKVSSSLSPETSESLPQESFIGIAWPPCCEPSMTPRSSRYAWNVPACCLMLKSVHLTNAIWCLALLSLYPRPYWYTIAARVPTCFGSLYFALGNGSDNENGSASISCAFRVPKLMSQLSNGWPHIQHIEPWWPCGGHP